MTRRSDLRRLLTEVREQVESRQQVAEVGRDDDRKVLIGVDLDCFEDVNTDAMTLGQVDTFETPQAAAGAFEGVDGSSIRGGTRDGLLGDVDADADPAGE